MKNPEVLQSISLEYFIAGGNQIENVHEIIEHLNSSIKYLDLSGSPIGKANINTFEGILNLRELALRNTNLTIGDSNPFEPLEQPHGLDLKLLNVKSRVQLI